MRLGGNVDEIKLGTWVGCLAAMLSDDGTREGRSILQWYLLQLSRIALHEVLPILSVRRLLEESLQAFLSYALEYTIQRGCPLGRRTCPHMKDINRLASGLYL